MPTRRRNIAKMLARLHPRGMSEPFSGARSTAPQQETALDIAGALGAAGRNSPGHRFAIQVLCLRWWPGQFEGPLTVVGHRAVTHWRPRVIRSGVRAAQNTPPSSEEVVEQMPIERPSETAAFRRLADMLGTRLAARVSRDRARLDDELVRGLRAWTKGQVPHPPLADANAFVAAIDDKLAGRVLTPDFLAAWARAVIEEYRHPNHCTVCQGGGERLVLTGLGSAQAMADMRSCDHCIGQGVLPWSKKRRAQQLVIGEHPFRNHLNTYHEGALALLRELEYRGAILLLRHIESDHAMEGS
ncbi:hypothetical protein [Lysobacter sp. CA196]|uniref:hypothetical protein n=1 Tax=Lysobacter sp. CA196 TaxID=3455606 RepID=UPI003F8D469A